MPCKWCVGCPKTPTSGASCSILGSCGARDHKAHQYSGMGCWESNCTWALPPRILWAWHTGLDHMLWVWDLESWGSNLSFLSAKSAFLSFGVFSSALQAFKDIS